mgnify:CR=1 FL=1
MREVLRCKCGKTLGIQEDDVIYIRNKGREVVIAPEYGAGCKVYVTCERCKCKKTVTISSKGVDFTKADR